MNSRIDYRALQAWCEDAISILATTGVPESIVGLQRSAVAKNSATSALYSIADSLAEGLSFLPDADRRIASDVLVERHGFDFRPFVDRKLKKVIAIFKRGVIRNDSEFSAISEFSSDTTQSRALVEAADDLLAHYERQQG